MTEKEMKLLHERMKKEDPKLLVLMEKCFDAGVMSGKEQAQRTWVGLTDKDYQELHLQMGPTYFYQDYGKAIEAKLKEKNQ